jgi:hypothetical protein
MSNETSVNDQPTQNDVESTAEVIQEPKKDTVAYDSYRKVVGKSKKVMAENEDLRNRLQEFEQQKMADEGRKDELIKTLRNELDSTKNNYEKEKQTYAWNVFSGHVKTAAAKRNCLDPDKLLRLLDKEDLGAVEVNDDYSVNTEDLDRLLDKAMKENEFLFQKPAVKVNDVTPNNEKPSATSEISGMTKEQMLQKLAELT